MWFVYTFWSIFALTVLTYRMRGVCLERANPQKHCTDFRGQQYDSPLLPLPVREQREFADHLWGWQGLSRFSSVSPTSAELTEPSRFSVFCCCAGSACRFQSLRARAPALDASATTGRHVRLLHGVVAANRLSLWHSS